MKAFDFLATRVVILLVEVRVAKRTIHIQPIRELKIKKPKHENLIFFFWTWILLLRLLHLTNWTR